MADEPYEYQEFPKMLFHPDGSTATVFHESQQSELLTTGWHPTPQLAAAERNARDEKLAAEDLRAAAKAKA